MPPLVIFANFITIKRLLMKIGFIHLLLFIFRKNYICTINKVTLTFRKHCRVHSRTFVTQKKKLKPAKDDWLYLLLYSNYFQKQTNGCTKKMRFALFAKNSFPVCYNLDLFLLVSCIDRSFWFDVSKSNKDNMVFIISCIFSKLIFYYSSYLMKILILIVVNKSKMGKNHECGYH